MYSHNIASPERSKRLPGHVHTERPNARASVSRSAARALDIMEHLADANRPLRAIELAQATGLHASTTRQILKTLVDSGHLLFHAEDKTYLPSPRLVKLGLWLSDHYFGDNRIAEILSSICKDTNRYVALFAQNDIYMQIIEHQIPAGQASTAQIGVKVPVFGSSTGAALLADRSAATVARLMERARVPVEDRTELLQGLEKARTDGYAFGGLSPDDRSRSIAVCLPRSFADVPLVVGIGGDADEISARKAELVDVIRGALEKWFGPAGIGGRKFA